jgi:ribonuclease III
MDITKIQNIIGYNFVDPRLLKTALTHRSYMAMFERDEEIKEHNERLEFLGDAVLELIVTDHLYRHHNEAEGMMTSLRASLVNYKTIGEVGVDLGLDYLMNMSKSEAGEENRARLSIIADAIEALIGAMYLDGGYSVAEKFIQDTILPKLPDIMASESYKDPKTKLQEFTQKAFKLTPKYKIISTEGKDHEKVFLVGVWIKNEMQAQALGTSKQEAETAAAEIALEKYQDLTEI